LHDSENDNSNRNQPLFAFLALKQASVFHVPWLLLSVFENTYFTFFQISKKRDFLRFFEMTCPKKRKKSLAEI